MLIKTEGVVLRTRDLGEADKIVSVLTPEHGKMRAAARGARRVRSRLLGAVQVFTHGRYMLFCGKSLHTLSQAEIICTHRALREQLEPMALGMYITELVDALTEEEDPVNELFQPLLDTLAALAAPGRTMAVRSFEVKLMQTIGYAPQLDTCLGCAAVPSGSMAVSPQGGLVCSQCRPQYADAVPVSRETLEIARKLVLWPIRQASRLQPSNQAAAELETFLRRYLCHRLERPLQSLAFLESLGREPSRGGAP